MLQQYPMLKPTITFTTLHCNCWVFLTRVFSKLKTGNHTEMEHTICWLHKWVSERTDEWMDGVCPYLWEGIACYFVLCFIFSVKINGQSFQEYAPILFHLQNNSVKKNLWTFNRFSNLFKSVQIFFKSSCFCVVFLYQLYLIRINPNSVV